MILEQSLVSQYSKPILDCDPLVENVCCEAEEVWNAS